LEVSGYFLDTTLATVSQKNFYSSPSVFLFTPFMPFSQRGADTAIGWKERVHER
jgi:hypothetical protein